MILSANYICPLRGLATLAAPDPEGIRQTGQTAKGLGLQGLHLPVLESAVLGGGRSRTHYLDGLIHALDQMAEAGLWARIIAPAQRILSLDWVPPYLARGGSDPRAKDVFIEGKVRNHRPYDWWADASIVQRRIGIFRELVVALAGHPAMKGWVIMDRALDWSRPEPNAADLLLRSYKAEIRERDEGGDILLSIGWSQLLNPDIARLLAPLVTGIKLTGLDTAPELEKSGHPGGHLLLAGYVGTLAQWLFDRPVEVELGWGVLDTASDGDALAEASGNLSGQGPAGIVWATLVDPSPQVAKTPPWNLRPGLDRIGLLDDRREPKEPAIVLIEEALNTEPRKDPLDFIDISPQEYMSDPAIHFHRLWDHYKEAVGF